MLSEKYYMDTSVTCLLWYPGGKLWIFLQYLVVFWSCALFCQIFTMQCQIVAKPHFFAINFWNKYLKNVIMVCFSFQSCWLAAMCIIFTQLHQRKGVHGSSVYMREREVAIALEKLASLQVLPDLSPPMHQLLSLNRLLNWRAPFEMGDWLLSCVGFAPSIWSRGSVQPDLLDD